jgi:stalled ribosome rescue protein Dom34
MKNSKKLAVYLDHSHATLFNYGTSAVEFRVIESEFNPQNNKGEHQVHNKEQHLLHKYYENIGIAILDFDYVLLFGPTDAKTELFNYLSEIPKFGKIDIKVKTADKLSENQKLSFVDNYFLELK